MGKQASLFIGTAGWNIPRAHRHRFTATGSQIERYASCLNGAEINTSFYRPHGSATYERWAAAVPPAFRFAVKVPKVISHERALVGTRAPLERFLDEIAGLGKKLGPLLLQLPPRFEFDARRVGRFFELLRKRHRGAVVCEPRHASWTAPRATELLTTYEIARVAADPPRAAGLDVPGGWRGLMYHRLHGSPRPYFSPYSAQRINELAALLSRRTVPAWCIFDNTGSGSAAGNALELVSAVTDTSASSGSRKT